MKDKLKIEPDPGDAEIIAIAKGEAELHGVTPGPIGYRAVEVPK